MVARGVRVYESSVPVTQVVLLLRVHAPGETPPCVTRCVRLELALRSTDTEMMGMIAPPEFGRSLTYLLDQSVHLLVGNQLLLGQAGYQAIVVRQRHGRDTARQASRRGVKHRGG